MIRFNLLRAAALLALCALLASPLAAAPKFRSESSPTAAAVDLFGWLRGALSLMWSKAGCQIDPNGRCSDKTGTPPPVSPKNGCQLDPFGRCIGSTATNDSNETESGCGLDPFGRCGS